MMDQHKTNATLQYPSDVHYRPRGNVRQQLGAMFVLLGSIVMLLWFIE